MSQLYEKLHGDMIIIFESSVDPEFKIVMNQKLESIKEKLNKIVKFKEIITVEGLKTLEKVLLILTSIFFINSLCILIY